MSDAYGAGVCAPPVVSGWMESAGIAPNALVLQGLGIQTRFVLRFNGTRGVGTTLAKQARDNLRNADGAFKELKARHLTQADVHIVFKGDC